nr:PAS domain-containing protein [Rhizobium sp. BK060]
MERPVSEDGEGAEEALVSGEQELRLLVDTIPALVWSAGPEGNIEYVNQRLLEYLGATLGEITGDGWMETVHPDDVAFKTHTWLRNLESGTPHDVVCRFRGADGRYRWFVVNGAPLKASDGRVLRWYGVLIDIDDRTKAEEALRESEYKLRQIIDTVPGLIWSTGPDGEPTHVSQRLLDYSGMRLEDFKHVGWEAFVHPDDVPETAKAFDHAIQTGTSYRGVLRLRRADGEFRWHHARCEPLRDRQGRIIQWYGLSFDIDEGKKTEEWPRFVTQLQSILNVLPAYTWYGTPSGSLTFVNKRQGDFLGVPKDHPLRFGIDIGAQWDDWIPLLHPDDHEEARRYWSNLLRSGEGGEHDYRVRDAQGNYRWFLTHAEPLRASDGTLLLWIGTTLDIEELKCTEQALRESEYRLRQIIDTVPGLIWSTGPDGEPTHANQRLLDYTGTRLEDFKNRKWERFLHPDDLPDFIKTIDHAIQTGTSCEAVYRLRQSNGGYFWHHARIEPLRDPQGQIIQWYGLSVDVDQGKKSEDRLRHSEAYLAEAQRLSHTGSAAYNNTALLYWSDETYRILEFDPRNGLPSRDAVEQRIHPGDRERVREEARRAVEQKRDYKLEYRIELPAGNIKYIEMTAHPKFSANGELLEVVSTLLDVTERKRAEQALRESEGKFRDYAESASDWFWEIGPDYRFTLLTGNAFGSDTADRLGKTCWDRALDLETEPEKWLHLQASLDSRKPFRDFVYCSDRHNGSPMYVKASGKPVFDANGEFRGYRGTGTDVTALMRAQAERERLRELESELAHMNRLSVMGELTASLAHEITQPIAAARNNARAATHFLDRNPPDLGEIREALACIVDDADRARDIIDRIRDHIKKAPPRKSRFDLNKAIDEVIGLARSAITTNGISVRTRLAEALLPIEGDRVQLQQVVLNLILNAVEAMSTIEAGSRELFISTEESQTGGVLVSVRDSGPGIDPDHVDRVFQAFYTTKSSGVGMGLSISRSIIDAHGGRLWADPDVSPGAVLRFSLPGGDREVTNSSR